MDTRHPEARTLLALACLAPAWVLAGVLLSWPEFLGGARLALAWTGVALLCAGALALWTAPLPRWIDDIPRVWLGRLSLLAAGLAGLLVVLGEAWGFGNSWIPLANLPAASALALAAGLTRWRVPRDPRLPALLLSVTALGLGLRLGLWIAYPLPIVTPDSSGYLSNAQSLLTRGEFTALPFRPPGYPAILAVVLEAFGVWGLRLLQAAAGIAIAVGVGLTVAQRAGRRAGAVAYAVCLLNPLSLSFEQFFLAETLFAALLVGAVLALLRGGSGRGDLRWLGAAGLLFGLAVLVKPVAQAAAGTAVLLTLLAFRPRRRAALGALAVLLGAACVVLPWCARNQSKHGFFGVTILIRGMSLTTGTAHVIDLDSPLHADIKRRIRPVIERWRAKGDLDESSMFWSPGGLADACQGIPPLELDRALGEIAKEGIKRDPLGMAWAVIYRGRSAFIPVYQPTYLEPFPDAVRRTAQVPPPAMLLDPARDLNRIPTAQRALTRRATSHTAARRGLDMVTGLLYPLFMLLPILGLLAALRARRWQVWTPVLLALATGAVTSALTTMETRYWTPLLPLFCLSLFSALGTDPRTAAKPLIASRPE